MTARTGGAGLLALSQSIPSLGRALMEESQRRQAQAMAEKEAAAQQEYRTGMLGLERDRLKQSGDQFGRTLEQGYVTHGFERSAADADAPGSSESSSGDAMLDAVASARSSNSAPPGLGMMLAHTALGREPAAAPPSTRGSGGGWRYNADSDPETVRAGRQMDFAGREGAANRETQVRVAQIGASAARSRGGGGGGGSLTGPQLARQLLPAQGYAEAFVREHPTAGVADIARWTRRRVPGLDEGLALAVAGDAMDAVMGKPGTATHERQTLTPSDRVSLRRAANDAYESEPTRADSAYHVWAGESEDGGEFSPAAGDSPQLQAWKAAAGRAAAAGTPRNRWPARPAR